MYDQERMNSMRMGVMTANDNLMEYLIDFSNGPDAMMVTAVENQCIAPSEENNDCHLLNIDNQNTIAKENNNLGNKPRITSIITISAPACNLNRRIKNPKPLKICAYCGKSFNHKGDYTKHYRRHTGEQPYKCDQCPQKFKNSSNLKRHQRAHSGEKPYKCTKCDKEFTRTDKLANHLKRKSCRANGTNTKKEDINLNNKDLNEKNGQQTNFESQQI